MLGTIIFALLGFAVYVIFSIGVERGKLNTRERVLVWSVVGAVYFGLLMFFKPWEGMDDAAAERQLVNAERQRSNAAFTDCGRHVRERLRLPDSVVWDHGNSQVSATDDGGYTIVRAYTAENSFGGRVRQTAICQHSGSRLKEVTILD